MRSKLAATAVLLMLLGADVACGATTRGAAQGTLVGAINPGGGPPAPPGEELAGTVTVFSARGKVIARRSVRQGHEFRFVLARGTYKINAGRRLQSKPGCDPKTVHVRVARTTRVNVETECGEA